jgi:hypothetical protein
VSGSGGCRRRTWVGADALERLFNLVGRLRARGRGGGRVSDAARAPVKTLAAFATAAQRGTRGGGAARTRVLHACVTLRVNARTMAAAAPAPGSSAEEEGLTF